MNNQDSLPLIFGSQAAYKILHWFSIQKTGHVRLIAGECRLYPSEAKNQLEKFVLAKVLVKNRDGNKLIYSLNESSDHASWIMRLFSDKHKKRA
jgi:hypothetical protein